MFRCTDQQQRWLGDRKNKKNWTIELGRSWISSLLYVTSIQLFSLRRRDDQIKRAASSAAASTINWYVTTMEFPTNYVKVPLQHDHRRWRIHLISIPPPSPLWSSSHHDRRRRLIFLSARWQIDSKFISNEDAGFLHSFSSIALHTKKRDLL